MIRPLLISGVFFLLAGCSKPKPEVTENVIPEADNTVTRYAKDLQTAPGRAQAAVDKMNASTDRTHQAAAENDPNQ